MNHINDMRQALRQVGQNQQFLSEGKIADRMRALNKERKKRWDKEGEKAKKDRYTALDRRKEAQRKMDSHEFINDIDEGYKNIDRKTGKMAQKAAIAAQEAGIRKMGGKAQREGGVRNAVRKALGMKPKERPERENPDNQEKETRAKSRAAKMIAVMSTHKPGVAQDREEINRERGSSKRARSAENNIRKVRREDYFIAAATLLGEGFAETTDEAYYMLEELYDINEELFFILVD